MKCQPKGRPMQFIRFESHLPLEGTHLRLGIFQAAFEVRDNYETSEHDANEIDRQLDWLKMHLREHAPLLGREHVRAICWFKDTAHEPMRRVWAIKPYLEAYGYWINVLKTRQPGNIIYEDGWQVAAKPWRK